MLCGFELEADANKLSAAVRAKAMEPMRAGRASAEFLLDGSMAILKLIAATKDGPTRSERAKPITIANDDGLPESTLAYREYDVTLNGQEGSMAFTLADPNTDKLGADFAKLIGARFCRFLNTGIAKCSTVPRGLGGDW